MDKSLQEEDNLKCLWLWISVEAEASVAMDMSIAQRETVALG